MNYWKKSLMARLVSYFLLLSLVIVGLVGYIGFDQAREALKQSIFDRLNAAVILKEDLLNNWVEEHRHTLLFIAQLPDLQAQAKILSSYEESTPEYQAAHTSLSKYLAIIVANEPDLEEIFILSDTGGKILVSTDKSQEGEYRVKASYFTQGQLDTFVQNIYPSPQTTKPTMTIATPLYDETGQRSSVLATHLNLARVDQIMLERAGLGESGETYLIDKFNVFISEERFGRKDFSRGVHSEGIDSAIQGRDDAGLYLNYAGTPVIGVYRWLDDRELALLAEMSQQEAFAPARFLAQTILLIGLTSTAILVVGGYLLARQIARPILAITDTAIQVAAGDSTLMAPVLTEDEVGTLARAFNQMTGQLRLLYSGMEEKVAELERSERALRLSDEILKQMPDAITLVDLEGNTLRWMGKAEEIFGYTAEEAVGRPINFLQRPGMGEAVTAKIGESIQETGKFLGEIPCVRKDGSEVPIEITATLIFDKEGNPIASIGINKDITERKQLEERLRQTQKMEAVGVLAGGVAHDFNNILTAILGYSELLLRDLAPNNPIHQGIEEIQKAGERAASLTRQLLAFSRKQVLQPKTLDLNLAVTDMERMLHRLIGEDIELLTILAPRLGKVMADPGQMDQVIMNLAVNGRDAMPYGGKLTIETKNITLKEDHARQYSGVPPGKYVMLAISDTGQGMDAETQVRIFEPFFTTKEVDKGTGMGLATAHGIIRQSGGYIWVYSEPEQGTTFKIYLPRIEEIEEGGQQEHMLAKPPPGEESILVVEDNQLVRDLAARVLKTEGYTVLTASDGKEGLRVAERHKDPIHLLLTDVVMPSGMSGRDLAERLATTRPTTKILYMSGYTDNAIVHHGVLDHDLEFLQKPFSPDALLRKIREVLDKS